MLWPFSLQGKVKQVTERTGVANKELLEPTPNFDCHVSRSLQSLPANSPPSQIFESSQVIIQLSLRFGNGYNFVWCKFVNTIQFNVFN